MLKKAIFATLTEQDEEHIMKQTDEAKARVLEAAEKIRDQYMELDIENIDEKRMKEVLDEALRVVESCEQVLGVNHPDTTELYHEIGSMYSDIKNYSCAVKWYAKGAELGNEDAQSSLAQMYQYGKGVETNLAKAIEWYTKAAEKGNEIALFELGEIYQYGHGVEVDYTKAVEWYIKATEKGDEFAYRELAWCLYMIEEYEKALPWAKKSVKEFPEDNVCHFCLASIYQALGRKEEALREFEFCLKLEEEQKTDDEIINETKDRIEELKHKE